MLRLGLLREISTLRCHNLALTYFYGRLGIRKKDMGRAEEGYGGRSTRDILFKLQGSSVILRIKSSLIEYRKCAEY